MRKSPDRPASPQRTTYRRSVAAGLGVGAVVVTAAAAHAAGGSDAFGLFARPAGATSASMRTAPTTTAVAMTTTAAPTSHRKLEQGGLASSKPAVGRAKAAMCGRVEGREDGRATAGGSTKDPVRSNHPLRFRNVVHPDDPGFTQVLDVGEDGTVVGYHGEGADVGHPNRGFEARPPFRPEDFVKRDVPRAAETQVVGINRHGVEVGFFVAADGSTDGFVRSGDDVSMVRNPRSGARPSVDQLLGVNNKGTAAGYFEDARGRQHAFLFDSCTGAFRPVRLPERADDVQATGVNDDGVVTGFYTKGDVTRGFVLDHGRFVRLSLGAGTDTEALGIDTAGHVVGSFTDRRGRKHGFVSSRRGVRTVDVPHARATVVNGIDDRGRLAGFFTTRGGRTVGFVAS